MRGVAVLATLLGLVTQAAAWDTLDVCNSQYNTLVTNYNNLNTNYNNLQTQYNNQQNVIDDYRENQSDYDKLETLYNRLQRNLTRCQSEIGSRVSNETYLVNERDKCQILLDTEGIRSKEKDTQIAALTQERDGSKTATIACLNERQNDMNAFNANKKILEDKANALTEEQLGLKQGLGECDRAVQTCEYDLNVTKAKVIGTCNEYMASNYYKKWIQLSDDQKKCLAEVLKRDRIAFLTTDTKESIMIFCTLTWDRAVTNLQKFEELGFIEKDTNAPMFNIDANLATDAKKYLSLAGYFKPIDISRGCVQRFGDLDKNYIDGKNWGIEVALFWFFLFAAVALQGRTVIRRILHSY